MTESNEIPPANKEQALEQGLVQLKVDDVNWKVLWKHSQTGEFWKEYFPHSESHGGGSSEFVRLTGQEAIAEFGLW